MDEGVGAKMVDEAVLEINNMLKAITVELRDFEDISSEEFHATQAEWDCYGSDWPILFYAYIIYLVKHEDELTSHQKATLTTLILRARGHKEEILQHKYAYPKLIDQDFEWMPELMSGTPEEKTILQNKYVLLSMSISLDEVEELCSGKRLVAQHDWDHGLGDWKTLLYDRITPLLENAAVLTAEQREKLADIIRRTRAIKDQILAHNYPYPEEVDQDYAWMKG